MAQQFFQTIILGLFVCFKKESIILNRKHLAEMFLLISTRVSERTNSCHSLCVLLFDL